HRLFSLSTVRPPPTSTLFPYTTLFRSNRCKREFPGGTASHETLRLLPFQPRRHGHRLSDPFDAAGQSFFLCTSRWPRIRKGHGLHVSVHLGQKVLALRTRRGVLQRLARAPTQPPLRWDCARKARIFRPLEQAESRSNGARNHSQLSHTPTAALGRQTILKNTVSPL